LTPRPDISIAVHAVMRELRFRSRPRMRTSGAGGSERVRLPEQVTPGRTYRSAGVKAWLRARIESSIARGDRELSDHAGRHPRRT
jgi:hypothetical protein